VLSEADTRAITAGCWPFDAGRCDPARLGATKTCASFVERKLIERIGDAGRRLHTGRSPEQRSRSTRLYLRRRVPLLQNGWRG
jgi:hypothetical protein